MGGCNPSSSFVSSPGRPWGRNKVFFVLCFVMGLKGGDQLGRMLPMFLRPLALSPGGPPCKTRSRGCKENGEKWEWKRKCKTQVRNTGRKREEIGSSYRFRCSAGIGSPLAQMSVLPVFHFTWILPVFFLRPISQSPPPEATPAVMWQLLLSSAACAAKNPGWF